MKCLIQQTYLNSPTHTHISIFLGVSIILSTPHVKCHLWEWKVLQASLTPGGGVPELWSSPLSFAGSWAARNGHSEARPRWWKVHTAGAVSQQAVPASQAHPTQGTLPRLLNVVPLLRYGLALLWFETVSIKCPSPRVGYISSLSVWFQNGKMKLTGPLSNGRWELK